MWIGKKKWKSRISCGKEKKKPKSRVPCKKGRRNGKVGYRVERKEKMEK